MDNNTPDPLGGNDLEVQDSPQQSTQPAPLVYDPQATIVYNASESYYGEVVPATMPAHEVSSEVRSNRYKSEQVLKFHNQIATVEELLKDQLKEVSDSDWVNFIKEIAQALNITLTRTVTVEATVDVSLTVEIDIDEDEPSEFDLSVEATLDGYTIDESDYYTRSFDVTES